MEGIRLGFRLRESDNSDIRVVPLHNIKHPDNFKQRAGCEQAENHNQTAIQG
jgi:hypothetical protein